MQLKVMKSDGTIEKYKHTKVLGSLNNALVMTDQANVFAAEQFAEAITYYFYKEKEAAVISTDEIHLMVQSVLAATGYENAAAAINEHRLTRRMKRNRIDVVCSNGRTSGQPWERWDKSRIVQKLVYEDGLETDLARTIASCVEEKVLNLGVSRVSTRLIGELVDTERAAMQFAEEQLMAAVG